MNNMFYSLEENEQFLINNFGLEFCQRSYNDCLSVEESLNANNQLADLMYGEEVAQLIRCEDISSLNDLITVINKGFMDTKNIVNTLDLRSLGMALIRPESINWSESYKEFLMNLGISIVYEKKLQINFEQYWSLYHHGMICPEAQYDFPTRTLNYINKDCLLLILYTKDLSLYPLADFLNSIKGKQGVYRPNTLRGYVAFQALKQIVSPNEKNTFAFPEYNLYFDPIGMCRHLVRGNINSDNAHEIADIPLLFYTGQAIHIPDSAEILNDLSVLCNMTDLSLIQDRVKILQKKK